MRAAVRWPIQYKEFSEHIVPEDEIDDGWLVTGYGVPQTLSSVTHGLKRPITFTVNTPIIWLSPFQPRGS